MLPACAYMNGSNKLPLTLIRKVFKSFILYIVFSFKYSTVHQVQHLKSCTVHITLFLFTGPETQRIGKIGYDNR